MKGSFWRILVVFIFMGLMVGSGDAVFARKQLLSGRGEGMASITIDKCSQEAVADAVQKVFEEDGYELDNVQDNLIAFSRPASRMKDISYGGIAGDDTFERVVVAIHEQGASSYRVECNVYMTQGKTDRVSEASPTVLRAFGKEYQRMLRKVKRTVKHE